MRRRAYASWIGVSALAFGLVGATTGLGAAAPAKPQPNSATESRGNFDLRAGGTHVERASLARRSAVAAAKPAVQTLLSSLGGEALVEIDGLTGTPRVVARLDALLTGSSSKSASSVALDYVRANRGVFNLADDDLAGMKLRRDYVDIDGIHHLSWVQYAGSLPLFGNGLQASVTKDGRLINVYGSPVAGLTAPSGGPGKLTAGTAISAARRDLNEVTLTRGRSDTAHQVLFQTPGGTRTAWETVTMSATRPAVHVIDAQTGRILFRQSLSSDAAPTPSATGTAFDYFPSAPRGGTSHQVNFTANGWLPATARTLSGNNVHAYSDVNADDTAQASEEVPPKSGTKWNYNLKPVNADFSFCGNPYPCTWDPNKRFNWNKNRAQDTTQVFYFDNVWHDHLLAAPIGFTEAAGNFQRVNTSGSGVGGDAVLAESLDGANTDNGLPDGSHIDNANMSTPPDGQAPRMQMYLQHEPGTTYPDGDPFAPTNVGDEADTVYHEYTHGLSNRLVVDPSGVSTLGNIQAGSMGEAWSDWYAMDYLVAKGLQRDTPVSGDVVLFQFDGAGVALDRTEPVDCAVGTISAACPGTPGAGRGGYTYGDFGKVIGRPEVHSDGEIWAQTLWDLRGAIGSTLTESLVTRAMELSPANPSFLDERNAILQADIAIYGGHQRSKIWKVFANRGMGWFAGAANGDDAAPVEDFSMPPVHGTPRGTLTGRVTEAGTGKPVAGAAVFFGGHASGFAGDYAAVTSATGAYTITGIFAGTYPKLTAGGAGLDAVQRTVSIGSGTTTQNFVLVRDLAAASGGATVVSFTPPDFTPFGCGPGAVIDQSLGTGWGSTSDLVGGAVGRDTPKAVVIRLPATVAVGTIAIDPNATCGDEASASTAGYKVETSANGTTWAVAAQGTFHAADNGRLNRLTPAAGTGTAVRYLRVWMLSPQVFQNGLACPGSGASGCDFLDMSEVALYAPGAG